MAWTTLHLQVTSPLFNSGDGTDAGVRTPSLRGVLRYWFRTLAGITAGPDLETLAKLEARVFGGTDTSSPVRLRIPTQPTVEPEGAPDWCNQGDDGLPLLYLLGQRLAKPVRDARRPRGGWPYQCTLLRPYVPAGASFDVKFAHRDADAAALVLASLWLLATYGGLGARTHRADGVGYASSATTAPCRHRGLRTASPVRTATSTATAVTCGPATTRSARSCRY